MTQTIWLKRFIARRCVEVTEVNEVEVSESFVVFKQNPITRQHS